MTDSEAALASLVETEGPERDQALEDFYQRWQAEPLVLDKWFRLQATSSLASAFERVQELARHPAFTLKNPNRVRALLGAFAFGNLVHFHRPDGAAYAFYAERLLELDALNPQVAARLVSAFNAWKHYEPMRRAALRRELERIARHAGLSKDVGEIVGRALAP